MKISFRTYDWMSFRKALKTSDEVKVITYRIFEDVLGVQVIVNALVKMGEGHYIISYIESHRRLMSDKELKKLRKRWSKKMSRLSRELGVKVLKNFVMWWS